MRKVLVSMLLVTMMIAAASAELLTTANPIGQGKWAVMGFGMQDSNVFNMGNDWKMTSVGAYGGYGVTDTMDVYLSLGSANLSGQPAALGTATGTAIGLNGKYTILEESSGAPVSVAAGIGYRSNQIKASALLGGDNTITQLSAGVGVSKMMIPFIPYGAIAYRSNAVSTGGGNNDFTQLDITVGTAIAWSAQGAVFLEYTNQGFTPKVGSTYTSGQIAAGVGYML